MELNNGMRQTLLAELAAAETDKETAAKLINKHRETDPEVHDAFCIKEYLADQRIKAIREAIISNQIDY